MRRTYIIESMQRDWVTVREAADWLRISKITVTRAINAGRLPAWRVGCQFRIERSAVEAFAKPVGQR
jgi:excisionase family DNA binding protein